MNENDLLALLVGCTFGSAAALLLALWSAFPLPSKTRPFHTQSDIWRRGFGIGIRDKDTDVRMYSRLTEWERLDLFCGWRAGFEIACANRRGRARQTEGQPT